MAMDPSDDALRDRLERLLDAVPAAASDPAPRLLGAARPPVVARPGFGLTGLTLALIVVVAAALAFNNNRPHEAGGPVTAVATDGPFKLTLTVPHAHYAAGQAITGITAKLEYTGPAPSVSISHALELMGFAVASADGRHKAEPAWAQSCNPSELSGAAPASVAFTKSGGYWPEESDFPWLQAYFSDQSLVLDAGTWTITAVAQFSEGDCGGPQHDMRASAAIDVGGSANLSERPSTAASESPTVDAIDFVHFEGDGFGFDHPADWQILATPGHVGIHGPTLEAALGIGDFDLGCSETSTSVSCPADPVWSVPHNGVVLVYRFEPWLGMCAPATPPRGAPDEVAYVGGRAAHLTRGERWMTWEFPGAPELIEARWGDANDAAQAQIEQVIKSWTWAKAPGCPLATSAAAAGPGDPSLLADDPRFAQCGIPVDQAWMAFTMAEARDFSRHFPGWSAGADELLVDDPALVVIGPGVESRGGNPNVDPLATPALGYDMCIVVGKPSDAIVHHYGPTRFDAVVPDLGGPAVPMP